jgi:hypothetical protein
LPPPRQRRPPIEPGDTIRERGFRRWYEQQLYESFALLVTGFVSLIMMAIALEAVELRRSAAGLLAFVAIAFVGGGACVLAWRCFHRQLQRAEYLAERASCPDCGVYARFAVLHTRADAQSPAGCALDVRCRKCGREWTMR